MPEIAILAPAPGQTVMCPETRTLLAEEGEPRELNAYWKRRLAVGDAVRVEKKGGKA
jgi:hypothetical protein